MSRNSFALMVAGAAIFLVPGATALGVDYTWNALAGGNQAWDSNANWLPSTGFPNNINSSANLSVPLAGNLNVSIGNSIITVGGLNIGGTGAAVATEISGTGGKLVFSNNDDPDFNDDNRIDGLDFLIWQANLGAGTTNATGDANGDGVVDAADLRSFQNLYGAGGTNSTAVPPVYVGRVFVNSGGVPGSTNRITVPVRSGVQVDATPTYRPEVVEVRGTNSLNLAGGYRLSGDVNTLRSFLPAGTALTVGPILLEEDTEPTPTTNRSLTLNDQVAEGARIELTGVISGGGGLNLGNLSANAPLTTFLISGNNNFTGRTTLNRANVILGSNTALGDGSSGANLRTGNPSNVSGFNLMSDNDERTINVPHQMAQFTTITGDHSLTWAGITGQTNSRGLINLLPAGKTFTHSGNIYAVSNTDTTRAWIFDGSGTTIVTGAMSGNRYVFAENAENNGSDTIVATLVKGGSGALYLNGTNSYTGTTTVNGGNLHFRVFDDNTATSSIVVNFGAVGVDSGEPLLTNFLFWLKMAPTSTGGLMINSSDAAATFDFTAGELGGATSAGARLSLAAPETGLTFTGSIVPAEATYRLGGGAGTLTLPNAQLTGAANRLVVTNGGVVQLNGANTYSGTTSVLAKYTTSLTAPAAANGAVNNAALNRVYGGTTLAVSNLANGGSPSSIGNSSSAAANLLIQGSTLRYTGAAASTDRLFTVGTGGATLEASGTGAINFTNAGSLGMDEAEGRDGTTIATNNGNITDLATTEDLVIGMPVSGANIAANATIAAVTGPTSIQLSANSAAIGPGPLTFGSVARTLTLGGTNTGDNTLRPNIVNGGAATSVAKTGAGKWILTGSNTYTGATTVSEGTLLVNGTNSGGGAVTVAAAGTLGGSGAITGSITVNGTVSAGSAGAGTLTVTGGVTFNAGSTALFEIGGTGATEFDQLNMSGALVAGGTIDVDLIGGFTPAAGNAFDLLDFASATGSFTLSLPALGAGLAWNTSALTTTGTISVVAGAVGVPEPSSAALAALGLAAAMTRRRRR